MGLSERFSNVGAPYFLATNDFPEAHVEYVKIHDLLLEAEVFRPPQILNLFSQDQAILFVSKEFADGLGTFKRKPGLFIRCRLNCSHGFNLRLDSSLAGNPRF